MIAFCSGPRLIGPARCLRPTSKRCCRCLAVRCQRHLFIVVGRYVCLACLTDGDRVYLTDHPGPHTYRIG